MTTMMMMIERVNIHQNRSGTSIEVVERFCNRKYVVQTLCLHNKRLVND